MVEGNVQKLKLQFTEKEWEEEMRQNRFCGRHDNWFHSGCFLECPSCGSRGFYGPKGSYEKGRKYRACKFCGFWQEASGPIHDARGGKPYRCVMVTCPHCSGYDWRLPWEDDWGECEDCKSKLKQVSWPTEDSTHPFHQAKAIMDRIHNSLSSQ